MADSFINKLTESTTVKGTDFTAFDIADPSTGGYFTKKVSFDNLTSKIKTDVSASVQTQINNLQTNLNTVSRAISNKLDKNGLTFDPTERMNGTLVVNSTLSGLGVTHFNQTVDLHNNSIINVKDPTSDYEAVNLKTVNTKIAAISIPNTSNLLLKTGDTMTGSLVLKGFSEKATEIIGTGSVSLNLDNGNTFPINLTGNITGFTLGGTIPTDSFTIKMFITQTGAFVVNFTIAGTSVKWANGTPPVVTTTNGKTDVFYLTKVGANWYGFIGGQNF
jgi:hypothetical protein